MRIENLFNDHRDRYLCKPTANEVTLLIVGQDLSQLLCHIVLCNMDTKLVCISKTHRAYDALKYPLTFGVVKMDIDLPSKIRTLRFLSIKLCLHPTSTGMLTSWRSEKIKKTIFYITISS